MNSLDKDVQSVLTKAGAHPRSLFGKPYYEMLAVTEHLQADCSALCCPRCNMDEFLTGATHEMSAFNGNLHQGKVHIFNPAKEDADSGLVATVDFTTVESDSHADVRSNNPSLRRQGLLIAFTCELCHQEEEDEPFYLSIYQHKGTTYTSWYVPASLLID